jgi:hypothetical protein
MSSGVMVWACVARKQNKTAMIARTRFIRIVKSCEILKSCPKAETGFQDFTGFTRRKNLTQKPAAAVLSQQGLKNAPLTKRQPERLHSGITSKTQQWGHYVEGTREKIGFS